MAAGSARSPAAPAWEGVQLRKFLECPKGLIVQAIEESDGRKNASHSEKSASARCPSGWRGPGPLTVADPIQNQPSPAEVHTVTLYLLLGLTAFSWLCWDSMLSSIAFLLPMGLSTSVLLRANSANEGTSSVSGKPIGEANPKLVYHPTVGPQVRL